MNYLNILSLLFKCMLEFFNTLCIVCFKQRFAMYFFIAVHFIIKREKDNTIFCHVIPYTLYSRRKITTEVYYTRKYTLYIVQFIYPVESLFLASNILSKKPFSRFFFYLLLSVYPGVKMI